MHELSIAEAIAAIAERHADGRRITRVEVSIGHLRQVVPAALEFAFELVAPGVELAITEVPAAGRCRACGAHGTLDAFPFACTACGALDVEVIAGEELVVESLDLEEEAAYGR
jgi:hydrogenase nickel incorporation protein HypA/HybF